MRKSNGVITLVPTYGLCNRMRAIASAKALSETIGSQLHVVWIQDSGLASRFCDLFEPIEPIKVTEYSQLTDYLTKLQTCVYRSSRFPLVKYVKQKLYHVILENIGTDTLSDEKVVKDLCGKKVLVSSFAKFYSHPLLSFDFMRPSRILSKQIDEIAKEFNEYTVGVHVRRTDNKKSILNSPTERFFEKIEEKIRIQPNFNFFLATDCPDTEHRFVDKFGSRVISQKKKFNRSTTSGIQSAVIDLYLLSKTSEVIGSYHSSFSHTAADISGIPENTVRSQSMIASKM